jgi:hypothetical protein
MLIRNYLTLIIVCILASCSNRTIVVNHPHHGHVPPGQAKKMTGSKSAKPYAPGQQKKH